MSDLISRREAIDAIRKSASDFSGFMEMEMYTVDDAITAVNTVPSAEPVRHGKWVNANEGRWNTCEVLKCSECGELDNRMYKTDKYCPNCGCRMDVE